MVTSANCDEDLTGFIGAARPRRWKIMQVLPLSGPDVREVGDLAVTTRRFNAFVRRNRTVRREGIVVVPERNRDMVNSYAMVDPAGRFYDNAHGRYSYSSAILEVGVEEAFAEVNVLARAFHARGGAYDLRPQGDRARAALAVPQPRGGQGAGQPVGCARVRRSRVRRRTWWTGT